MFAIVANILLMAALAQEPSIVPPVPEQAHDLQLKQRLLALEAEVASLRGGRPILNVQATHLKGSIYRSSETFQGPVSFTGPVTVTGPVVRTSTEAVQAITGFGNGDSLTAGADLAPMVVRAYFVDGATQSSGCVVGLAMSGTSPDSYLTASSTTTTGARMCGVLTSTSNTPNTWVNVAIFGAVRAQSQAGQADNQRIQTSATRCKLRTDAGFSGPQCGITTGALDGDNWQSVLLK